MSNTGKFITNTIGSVTGANAARDAAQAGAAATGQAAVAQQAEARRQFDLINTQGQNLQNDVMAQAGKYSVQQLNALDQSLSTQQKNIAQQEQLMAAINPTLMEASKQALLLLQGGKASSLDPLNNQRAQQRLALQNSLRAQGLGDGSSAALNALQKFDTETASLGNQAQQQQLGTLLGTSLNSRVDLGQSAGQLANLGNQYGQIGQQNAALLGNIGTSRLGALSGAGQQLINNAGAQFAGSILGNQANAQYYTNGANLITQAAGAGLGGYLGGASGAKLGLAAGSQG